MSKLIKIISIPMHFHYHNKKSFSRTPPDMRSRDVFRTQPNIQCIVNDWKSVTILAKSSILDAQLGSEYSSILARNLWKSYLLKIFFHY